MSIADVMESFTVNFVGPNDEFVVSGSDEGYFFLWRRESGALHGIYEGDGSVVNVIEAHPTLPLLAVSGIDHEPKVSPPPKCIILDGSRYRLVV